MIKSLSNASDWAEPSGVGARRLAVATVYLVGFLQGLTLVSFPASSAILKQMHGFTDAQYGAIFLPQVAFTVLGAVGGGALARRLGLQRLLWLAVLGNGLSQLALAASAWLAPSEAFPVILMGTAAMGLGFGLAGAPINAYPPLFFPRHSHSAVVALHTLLGLGLAVGPLLVSCFSAMDAWVGFPLLLLAISAVLAMAAALVKLPHEHVAAGPVVQAEMPHPVSSIPFWVFAIVAVAYAFAEGTFSNWAVIYLREVKNLPAEIAALSLSSFWIAMVLGRLLVSALVVRVMPQLVWLTLPVLMIAAFLLLPYANNAMLGLGLFGLAGLSCSAFFPLTITLASERFPVHVAWVSSMLIAALMVGVGMGSFVIGPLRDWLPLEQVYRFSVIYPVLVIFLALWLVSSAKRLMAAA